MSDLPFYLREDSDPAAQCSDCRRKSWDDAIVGMRCAMPQPSGMGCDGIMVATATWWRGAYGGTEGKP